MNIFPTGGAGTGGVGGGTYPGKFTNAKWVVFSI